MRNEMHGVKIRSESGGMGIMHGKKFNMITKMNVCRTTPKTMPIYVDEICYVLKSPSTYFKSLNPALPIICVFKVDFEFKFY